MPNEKEGRFRHVVLQPTSLCNMNCHYCYLPDRNKNKTMSQEVVVAVADSIQRVSHQVTIVWHGGEPLACGLDKFRELVRPFAPLVQKGKISHNVQTNATLISDEWCEFFKEEGFRVGVSVDGSAEHNSSRVDWSDRPTFDRVMEGIDCLKDHEIDFGVIAVVNPANVEDPEGLYNFFVSLGCDSLNVNIEEKEGINRDSEGLTDREVRRFWGELFQAWIENPVIKIREFDRALGWLMSLEGEDGNERGYFNRDFWPTVSVNGDLCLLSPEFISTFYNEREQFIVGNILETPLHTLVRNAFDVEYVREFFEGVGKCAKECPYYEYCGGGQASNKYFELGSVNGTETDQCRHTRQLVLDAVIDSISLSQSE